MTELTGYEDHQLDRVEEILDGNPSTSAEVYRSTIDLDPRAVAAVAAKRSGGGGYAAGTDRLVARLTSVTIAHGAAVDVDWTGAAGFVAGDAVAVVADNIVFQEDGCYHVHVHLPHALNDGGDPAEIVDARLALLLLGNQWADGDDDHITGGGNLDTAALSASYTYCHNAGDVLGARIQVPGAVDGIAPSIFAQIVKLSDVPSGNEFA